MSQTPEGDKRPWPHAPEHRLAEGGTFMVTAGTYLKKQHFAGPQRLRSLHDGLLRYAKKYSWELSAWAVFPNHYHFVGSSPETETEGAESLRKFLAHFHQQSAGWVNKLDQAPNRKVWHNFWETKLTHASSYMARLNYVHQNAVKHGLVNVANQYQWCSARWFEDTAKPSAVRTIYSFKTDRIKVIDDF